MAIGASVAAVFTILDQITKIIAERVLDPGVFVPLLGDNIGWQLVYNPGGAWGVRAPAWIFLVVTVIVVVVVARALPRTLSGLQAAAYGLLLSGAIGNVLDRLLREGGPDAPAFGGGEVVDFVAWGTFPRFNIADSAITVGFVLLLFTLWRDERAAAARERAEERAASEAVDDEVAADHDPGSDIGEGHTDAPTTAEAAEPSDLGSSPPSSDDDDGLHDDRSQSDQ